MPRDGSSVYSADWVNAAPNTTIESSKQNAMVADLVTDANAARPITAGGTGATTAIGAADNLFTKSSDIASAATVDLSTATGMYVVITGTTTITAFGTEASGVTRVLRFSGALTLTHNATSLILPGAANIITAAGDTAIMVSEGSGNWRCLSFQKASVSPIAGQETLIVQERKSSGTNAGGNTGGSWTQRLLSEEVVNTITGASVDTGANTFTLPAGVYDFYISAPMYKVNGHKARLYNLTAAAVSILGASSYAEAANNVQNMSIIDGRLTVASTSTFVVESRGAATQASNGLGVPASTGDVEIYTTVRVTKVS